MELNFPFELKALTDAGTFSGLASVYNNIDMGGDAVMPGAFTKSLQERGSERPILWAHDTTQPVGLGKLTDTAAGLEITGTLDMDVQAGRDAYSRLQKRIVRGLSIGYRSVLDKMENGVRRLKAVDLYEVSLVLFPMNPAATVTSVKAAASVEDIRAYESWLRTEGGFSRTQARALAAGGWKALHDAPDEEELAVIEFLKQANDPRPRWMR